MPSTSASPMTVYFRISNTNYKPHEVFATFCGGGTLVGKYGSTALVPGKSVSFEQLAGGASISTSHDGRICISLGKPLTTATAANGYAPNFANPSLGDYGTRWDKAEISYANGSGGINLSAQDFFGVPLRISTAGQKSLTWTQSTAKVMSDLGKLSSFKTIANGFPQGALAVGPAGVTVPGVASPVLRVISPGTVTAFSDGSTVYPSLAAYLSFVEQSKPTTVWGNNGAGQWYNFSAIVSAGQLTLSGAVNGGSGSIPTTAQVSGRLTDTMVYGCNPPFRMTQGTDLNGMVTRAMADYFAGLNFGLVASPEKLPNHTAHTVGGMATWHWYGNNPNGLDLPKLPVGDAFAKAQAANPSYYNCFASYLTTVGGAYGFAYNDRLQSPLISIVAGQTVTIEVLPDTQA